MARISVKQRVLNLLHRLPPIFGDHHLPFILAAVSVLYGLVVIIIGEHYAAFVLEGSGLCLLLIGSVAVRLNTSPIPPSVSREHRKVRRPILIPAPIPLRNKGIELVHDFFIGRGVVALVKRLLDPTPVTPKSVMRDACERNPYSVFVLTDTEDEVRGTAELWAIKRERLEPLLKGEISEEDLRPEDFLDYEIGISHFYVAVTIPPNFARNDAKSDRALLLRDAIHGILTLLEKAYGLEGERRIMLYAVEVTAQGERTMEDLGFAVEEDLTKARRDKRRAWKLVVDQSTAGFLRTKYGLTKRRISFTPPHVNASLSE